MAKVDRIPREYRPLSMWEYFGYNLLYSIPIIGLIFMIVFALDSSNLNRRNFTRSFFAVFIIFAVIFMIMVFTGSMIWVIETLTGQSVS